VSLPPETEDALVALYAVRDGLVPEASVQKLLLKSDGSKRLARLLVETGKLSIDDKKALLEKLDPEVVAGYRIESEAGRGGMGVVYKARQVSMDRPVALKVLSRSCSEDEEFVERFIAEARSAARLNHEHVVAAIDAGSANGLHYFVMEFVDGTSVADMLEEAPVPAERTWEIVEQMAHALDHAHGKGIVHRDVKPENIMIGADGRAKLCDLGLARPAQVAGTGEKSDTTEGTPYYCSPEQALGRTDIDASSDVYSLGMTIYHMLKGEPAFDGDTAREILLQQVREPFPNLKKALPGLSKSRRKLLESMVLKDRHKRLGSMRAFLERLVKGEQAEQQAGEGGGESEGGVSLKAMAGATFLACAVIGAVLSGLWGAPPVDVEDPDPSPTEVAASPSPSAASPSPRPTRTGMRRAGDDPDGESSPTAAPGPVDDREAMAEDALLAAKRGRDRNPNDVQAYLKALKAVAAAYGDTAAGRQARDRIVELGREEKRLALRAFTQVAEQTTILLKKHHYLEAGQQVEAYAAEWALSLGDAASRLENLRQLVADGAQRRWSELKDQLQTLPAEEARQALEEFAAHAPQGLLLEVEARRDELAASAAGAAASAALDRVRAERDRAFAAGDLEGARRVVQGALDAPELRPVKSQVEAELADLELLGASWSACDASVRAWIDGADPRLRLRLAAGGELKGRVIEYDPARWSVRVKPYGERDDQALDLRHLHPGQALELVSPSETGRGNVLFFMARRAPDAAKAALEAWQAAGGGDPRLVTAISELEAAAAEDRAAAVLAPLLDEITSPQLVVDGVRALDEAILATRAYAEGYARLQETFRAARVAQLAADPHSLLHGAISERRGRLQIRYDFDEEEQARDWTADLQTLKQGRADWRDGALHVSGKVRHRAVFTGGELKVELKAVSNDDARPNINVVLSERDGWSGQLVGLGFIYGGLSRVNVDASAPRKPGYKVSLPANVFLPLQGHAPKRGDPWMAAENEPALLGTAGKTWRVRVERSDEGELRLRAGASRVYSLPAYDGWDQAGRVALLPFNTELKITEITVSGILDPSWAQDEAGKAAQAEANALPRPLASRQ
jgi:serine/threonine-protein kinase